MFIDAFTNERRTLREFQARVSDAATALAALGLEGEKGDVVGILSENNMVSPAASLSLTCHPHYKNGFRYACI